MVAQYSERARRPLSFVILTLLAITLTFTILAVSLHNLYEADIEVEDDTPKMVRIVFTVGAFSVCNDWEGKFKNWVDPNDPNLYDMSVHSCGRVSTDCRIKGMAMTMNGVETEMPQDDAIDWNCAEWNAFRAFFILSILFTALAIIASLLYIKRTMDWGMSIAESTLYYWSSVVCMIMSAIFLIIAWATAAATISEVDPDGDAKHGPAFGLAVTAWVTQMLALMGFVAYYVCDPNRKSMDSVAATKS